MNQDSPQKQKRYPFGISRVLVNAMTSVLATFLAVMFLNETFLLPYFVLSTITVTAVAFILKIHPIIQVPKSSAENQSENNDTHQSRRPFWILLVALIVLVVFPFLLLLSARVFEPTIWFALIASVAAGIGVSELLFYVYCVYF
jgi:predicted lysophospholipase L1 biosynthesis ABC-type transport system permease subunit